jgi:hypothetical protein
MIEPNYIPPKEHGLLMSAPLVLATMAGRKTVTRRISKRHDSWKVGDRIWIKETFLWLTGNGKRPWYRADGEQPMSLCGQTATGRVSWIPSLLMPRHASRILLEVTEPVRVERAHDINEEEAKREGVEPHEDWEKPIGEWSYVDSFALAWMRINDKPPKKGKPDARWSANPQVRRIAFKVIEVKR